MFVICKDKTVNLDKFETVQFRESLMGSKYGYPVEAIRKEQSGGIFGGVTEATEEIARLNEEQYAKLLVDAITKSWIAGEKVFDAQQWIDEQNEIIKKGDDPK